MAIILHPDGDNEPGDVYAEDIPTDRTYCPVCRAWHLCDDDTIYGCAADDGGPDAPL